MLMYFFVPLSHQEQVRKKKKDAVSVIQAHFDFSQHNTGQNKTRWKYSRKNTGTFST